MNIKIEDKFAADSSVLSSISGNKIVEAILKNRGISSDKAVDFFLHGDISMVHNPRLMKDAEKAAEVIKRHVENKNLICIYSDYDADGFGAIVTAVKLLQKLNANVTYFTNSRAIGYGANSAGVEKMLEKHPDVKLVVTTDNGIVAYEAVDILNSKGIEVVVTDHHEPSTDGILPNALAVVNPKRKDDTYPFKGLCGAGVIWKVMMLVFEMMGHSVSETYDILDIVAFSTVGDVVPLLDENRLIVKEGLNLINGNCRPEWDILRKTNSVYRREIKNIDARTLAFTFVPQVNACSRLLGSIEAPCDIFLSDDTDFKVKQAEYIKEVNEERKIKTNDQTERALTLCEGMDGLPVIIVESEVFDDGIVGIIAGRLKEAFWAPAIVLTKDPDKKGILRGSGRSIEGFKMKSILDEVQAETGLLEGYGGHDMACGLSLKRENLDAFRVAMCLKAVNCLNIKDYCRNVVVDVDIHDDESVAFVCDALSELEPYGCEFVSPTVRLKNFVPQNIKISGNCGQHVIFEGKNITVKCWNGAEEYAANGSPKKITAYGQLQVSSFDGKCELVVEPALIVRA